MTNLATPGLDAPRDLRYMISLAAEPLREKQPDRPNVVRVRRVSSCGHRMSLC